ncbi:beta-L-arabinofuranosidase domain-containing protein [Margalitia sp. FSL K6-0131]|uniref:beta-L-arabinofuranosidase domain-containing protein n=1 Tax=Margalitia sp. FSL K6-0131 TaxID=2954604 RepID=UPI0030F5BE6F
MTVKTNVKTKANPFALKDVSIIGGPFKHAMDLNKNYLLQLEPDRLLARFREYAGLEIKAPQYEGWEAMSLSGHTLGHYLSACSMLYASLSDEAFKQKVDYIVDEVEICQNAHGDGYVSGIPRGKELFLEVASGDIRSKGFDLNGGWAPLYTIHKLLAGLRDAYHLAENKRALGIACKLADWLDGIFKDLSDEQMEELMICEYGGMNEVLADLYADTGDDKYLHLAERFWHRLVLDPLSHGQDSLPGKHANTQIPKIIGLARQYELTDDEKRKNTAEFFWNRVVHHHSYVTGGNSFGEYFSEPDMLTDRLGAHTTETCNTYNMLKLTKHLFEWNGSVEAADYYERALYNHILASQDPLEGGVCYFVSLAMGGYKAYNHKFDHFTCCVGTGMENHASYGSGIYYHHDDKLYVSQYIASSLNWKDKGVTITQETDYPESNKILIRVNGEKDAEFTMCIRYPNWAEQGIQIKINGKQKTIETSPGHFIEIKRLWSNDDNVEISIPFSLRLECLPDNPNRAATMYGPLVLAGELGPDQDPEAKSYLYTPVMINNNQPLSNWVQPVEGKTNTFRTVNTGYPREVELYPFYRMHHKMYSVYWDLFTKEEWEKAEKEYKRAREKMRILNDCTIDFVQLGEMQPERDHHFQGETTSVGIVNNRAFRQAGTDGWFSVDMNVVTLLKESIKQDLMLVITYTSAHEISNCKFDILLDGEKMQDEKEGIVETDKFYNVNYDLPLQRIEGKEKVTVTFKANPGHRVRRVFGLRIVNKEEYALLGLDQ